MKTLLFILSLFFLLNTSNFSFAQTTWKRFPGKALDIASGPEGTIYIISTSKRVFKWDNQKNIWSLLDGLREVKEIAPMKHGMILALTQNGKLHYYHPGSKKWKNDWFIAATGMPSVIQSIHYSPDPKYGVSTLAESVRTCLKIKRGKS